jgi:hypothetical protein
MLKRWLPIAALLYSLLFFPAPTQSKDTAKFRPPQADEKPLPLLPPEGVDDGGAASFPICATGLLTKKKHVTAGLGQQFAQLDLPLQTFRACQDFGVAGLRIPQQAQKTAA